MSEKTRILLLGGTGFIGTNIIKYLSNYYDITAPTRKELDILDEEDVSTYLNNNKFDILVHSANICPRTNKNDKQQNMLEYTLKGFLNFEKHSSKFKKFFYIGSGAEYDKSRNINYVREDDIGQSIPKDLYGFAKYTINKIIRNSDNIYNIRLFGCYGEGEDKDRFITHALNCCKNNEPITIRKNCYFDYISVEDFCSILELFIKADLLYHDYNICIGKSISLIDMALEILEVVNNSRGIKILSKVLGNSYYGSNNRLVEELKRNYKTEFLFTQVKDYIKGIV